MLTTNTPPLDRLRQLLSLLPSTRPPNFENPLEKIEQLLTCPICLDRYRQPKLLPCHHTFCMPCLENCSDIVRRILKCPECRAEHPIPYDGVKNFQTNFTLIGFLDVHIQASDENAEQLEAYIHRYNLERCKICDEKCVLEPCAHCKRRACSECRAAHMDMLKRDINRMLTQVKRLSNRIIEAANGLRKGAELLTLNCETAKDEVHEYFRRYYRELKKREDMFIQEIETFHGNETRLMRNLRDVLEIESSNISEACTYLAAVLKGERDVGDAELAKLKVIFGDGLEYLRNFQPDADELFSKKLRFSPGDDVSKLPTAIANFGELTVSLPQFAGRYLPLEHSYLPRPLRFGYESDNFKYSSHRNDGEDSRAQNDSRSGTRCSTRNNDDDALSTRLRRRHVEEEAWNRLRMGNLDNERRVSSAYIPGNNPWSSSIVSNQNMSGSDSQTENLEADNNPINDYQGTPLRSSNQCENGHTIVQQARDSLKYKMPSPNELDAAQIEVNANVSTFNRTQITRDNLSLLVQNSTNVDDTLVGRSALQSHKSSSQGAHQSITGLTQTPSNARSESNAESNVTPGCAKITRKPPLPKQLSTDDAILNKKVESIRVAHEKRRELKNGEVSSASKLSKTPITQSSDDSESDSEQAPVPTGNRFRIIFRSQPVLDSNLPQTDNKMSIKSSSKVVPSKSVEESTNSSYLAALSNSSAVTDAPLPIPVQHYPGEVPSWLARRRQRYQRSKTNPDIVSTLTALSNNASISNSASSTTSTNNNRIQQLLLERTNRLDSSLVQRFQPLSRQNSGENLAANWPQNSTDVPSSTGAEGRARYRRQSSVTNIDRDKSCDNRIRTIRSPRFICSIDYQSKNKPKFVFGRKGSKPGELNWPRGIAPLSNNEFAVCDSSNHRICIFNMQGKVIRTFGKYGTGDGQLDSAAGICCNRVKQLIVSDRYNHRIVIFDQSGQFIRKFGGHGPSNGCFNSPWGIAIDESGLVHVADKDNHRIQLLDLKGQFISKIGMCGSGNEGIGICDPQYIAIHKRTQNVYVTDSTNHRVLVLDLNGNQIFQFGQEGFNDGEMKNPRGIAVDEQGFIVLADSGNSRVQIFYPDGRFMHSFGGWGVAPGQMKGVEAVALIDDSILISDRENHRIQIF